MLPGEQFQIRFSGLTLRFTQPQIPFGLSEAFSALLFHEQAQPDAQFEIVLLDTPLSPTNPPHHTYCGVRLYQTEEGWLRIHPLRGSENGCQVACLLRPNGKHTLYYPTALWEHYSQPLYCAHLMGIESILLSKDAFLLHSSVVMLDGKTVLFFGPSGVGKSTQAQLWQEHLGAQILNGDRCVIMKKDGKFYGGGSPLAGNSGIYRPEQAPIAAIFLLEHADHCKLTRMGVSALAAMLEQTLLNSWDEDFMNQLIQLYQQLLLQVPVYKLSCTPDRQAVELAYNAAMTAPNHCHQ
jgi:hypothetical protein